MNTQTAKKVLVIDDEPDIRALLEITLTRMGLEVDSADCVATAKQKLASTQYQLCLTDMRLPDGDGLELVKLIQQDYPSLPTAMITAFGSVETAIDALKAGAFDFLSKPVDLVQLRELVEKALKLDAAPVENIAAQQSEFLGKTPIMLALRQRIHKLARSQAPIYIQGESGSGKERVARLIHQLGPRAEGPFIPVNCAAIPTDLMESEFFGYIKGSFSGATADKPGLFQAAENGTLFLDEIADLPLSMQVKLLRAIQEKSVRPIGAQAEVPVNVRILSATHKNLLQQVENNEFREDLYYRINVIEVQVPSLRERAGDIPELATVLLQKIAEEYQLPAASLSKQALNGLKSHSFPGNVRELENILERAFALCEGSQIELADLNLSGTVQSNNSASQDTIAASSEPVEPFDSEQPSASLEDYLADIEKSAILKALDETRWNRTAAAKKLGISFRALRYRLQKLGLDQPDSD
ncbi:MAG: sigma-54 dependent transcriptional regulator [Pseudomonadales bacterium]|nr:sigma-54 dependent transcriptional regulator [Pseudomonadales bacterium]